MNFSKETHSSKDAGNNHFLIQSKERSIIWLSFALLTIFCLFSGSLSAQSVIPYSTYIPQAGIPSFNNGLIDSEFDGTGSYHLGVTSSAGFTTTAGAFQDTKSGGTTDVVLYKLDAAGQLVWSTYVGDGFISRLEASTDDIPHDKNLKLDGNDLYIGFTTESAIPGFTQIGPRGNDDMAVAKFDASTGAFQWGTVIGGAGEEDLNEIEISGGKVYVAGKSRTGGDPSSYFPITPDALEPLTTFSTFATLAIFDASTGAYEYGTTVDRGAGFSEIYATSIAGNTLALGMWSGSDRNTTPDAIYPTSSNGNTALVYFDIPTRQVVYDTYLGPDGHFGEGTQDIQTDGTRFYMLHEQFGPAIPLSAGEAPDPNADFFENIYLSVFNGTTREFVTATYGNATTFQVELKVDAANGRWFLYGGKQDTDGFNPITAGFSLVDPLQFTIAPNESSAYIREYAIGTNQPVFATHLTNNQRGVVSDVFLAPNGYLYIYGQATTAGGGLADNGLITADAIRSEPSAPGDLFLLKLDENRDIFYGSYLGNAGDIAGSFDEELTASDRINVRADGIVELSGWQQDPTGGTFILTDDAEFTTNNSGNFFYTQLDCCPDNFTPNTIDADQTVCILGLTEGITGPRVYIDETQYPDLLIGGAPTPQGPEASYQWQVSDDNIAWADVPGATLSDFLPAPTSATVYYRRVAIANSQCTNGVISNVHTIMVNTLAAPVLTEGVTNICPNTDILIGLPATGGTNTGYTYQWDPILEIDDATAAQPTFNGVNGAVYTVTVTDNGNNCQSAENWEVNVVPADAGEDKVLCGNASNGVLIGAPGVPGGEYTYSWTIISGDLAAPLSNPNVAQPFANPTSTTVYELTTTITSAGCSSTDQMQVGVSDPVADPGPDVTLCLGDNAILGTPAQPGITYAWSPGLYINDQNIAQPTFQSSLCPTDDDFLATNNPIRYSLTAIDDATGCTSTEFVDIYILQVDLFNELSIATSCGGSSSSVQIGEREAECGLDLPGVTFTWTTLSGDGLDPLDVNLEFPTVTPTVDSEYELTVSLNGTSCKDTVLVTSGGCGCGLMLEASSDIDCAVGGQYNTQIVATGGIETNSGSVSLDNLPPGYTFEWSPTIGLASPTSLTTAVNTLAVDQTYTFNVRLPNGDILCSDMVTVLASVAANPLIGITEEEFVCAGVPIEIGLPMVTGWTYVWTPAAGLSDPNISNPEATITADTEYTVEATDIVTGCVFRDTVTVRLEGPVADAGPDLSFCSNAIVRLGTKAKPGLLYSWTPALGLENANTAQPIDTIFSTVTYMLEVTDPVTGCTDMDEVTFTITSPPVYDAPDVSVCEGGSVVLGIPAQAGFSYFWSPATGLSDANVAQPIATPLETTTYNVTVSDGNLGCFAVDQVVVTVVPSTFSLDLVDIKECEGATATLGVADQGGTYSWSPITGLSDPNIADPTVTVTNTPITYTLTWTTTDGCTLQDDQMVMAYDEEALSFAMSYTICVGESVTIGAAAAEVGATYAWTSISGDGTGTLSSTSIHNPVATPTQNTTYRLTYTSPNGCISTKDVVVQVVALPILDLGPDQPVCGDVPIVITPMISGGVVGGGDYFESFEADLGSWVQSSAPDDDFDWTRDDNGTPTGNTGPSSGANGTDWYLYTEDNGASGATAIITSPAITLAPTTADMSFYYHRYSEFNRMGSTTLEVSTNGGTTWTEIWSRTTLNDGNSWNRVVLDMLAYSGMTINIRFIGVRGIFGGTYSDMAFDEISFPANTTPIISTYAWSNGETTPTISVAPLMPTTYSLTITDVNGCTATDEVLVTPSFVFSAGADQEICPGESITIGSTTTTPGLTYTWSIVSGPGPLPAPATTAQITVSPTATTTYRLTVDDGLGCIRTDDVIVTVDTPAPVNLGFDQVVCMNGCVTIGVPALAGYAYQWVPTTGISNPTQSMVTVCPTANIEYELLAIKTATGCVTRDKIRLTIGTDNAPIANAGADVIICSEGTAQLGDTGMAGLAYTWSPTTGLSDPTIANPTVTLTNTTNAQITTTYILSVLNPLTNCFAMDTVLVTVDPQPMVSILPVPTLCAGGTYPMSATATGSDLTYSWLPAAAFDDPTVLNPNFLGTATTTVTLVVTNGTGCQGTASTTITVSTETVVADAGPDETVCINDAVIIGGLGTTSGLTYSWSRAFFPGGLFYSTNGFWYTDGTFTNPTASPRTDRDSRDATFRLTVTGASGCTAFDEMVLLVEPTATINAGEDAIICGGTTATLSAASTSGSGTWSQFSGPTTATIASPNTTTTGVTGLTNGTYTFRWDVSGAICNPGSDFVTIEIVDPPVLVVTSPLCSATGGADLTAAEVTAGSTLNGALLSYWLDAAATVSIPDPTAVQAGVYYIRAFSSATSCEAILPVTVQVGSVVSLNDPADVCVDGTDMVFTGMPTDANGVFTTTAGAGFADNGDGTASLDVSAAGAGTYDVTYTYMDINGCEDSQTVSVMINPEPVVTLNDPADECIEDDNDMLFTGTPTDANGVFTTTAGAGFTDNGDGTASLDVSAAGAGTYDVTYTYTDVNGCDASETVTVELFSTPVVTVADPATICSTQAIDLTQGASILPADLGGTWTSSGNGDFATGMDFATATTYTPGSDDIAAGQVTLTLTSNDPDGPCIEGLASVTFTILKVDCGTFPWEGE